MKPNPEPSATMPPSVRWSAPWKWFEGTPPWLRWTLFVIAWPIGYVESCVLMYALLYQRLAHERFEQTPAIVYFVVDAVYYPLWEAAFFFPLFRDFLAVQINGLSWVLNWLGIEWHG